MRRGKRDANHAEISRILTQVGCTVADTSMVGAGFGDIVCGYRGKNWIFEIKDPAAPKGNQKLRGDKQKDFHISWRGQIDIIKTAEEAIEIITR